MHTTSIHPVAAAASLFRPFPVKIRWRCSIADPHRRHSGLHRQVPRRTAAPTHHPRSHRDGPRAVQVAAVSLALLFLTAPHHRPNYPRINSSSFLLKLIVASTQFYVHRDKLAPQENLITFCFPTQSKAELQKALDSCEVAKKADKAECYHAALSYYENALESFIAVLKSTCAVTNFVRTVMHCVWH